MLGKVDSAAVGSWRKGRLTYTGARLSRVASDLARATGQTVVFDPALANRPFTGTLRVDEADTQLFTDVADILGLSAQHSSKGWRLVALDRARN